MQEQKVSHSSKRRNFLFILANWRFAI